MFFLYKVGIRKGCVGTLYTVSVYVQCLLNVHCTRIFFLLHSLFIQSKKMLGGRIKNHHYIVLPHAHSFHYSPLSKRPAWPAGAPITFQQFWSLTHDKKRTISPARCITKYTFKPFMIVHFLRVWWSGTTMYISEFIISGANMVLKNQNIQFFLLKR